MVYITPNDIKNRFHTYVECFFERYKSIPLHEKILDIALLFAIFFGITVLILEHSLASGHHLIEIFHRIDKFLISVFVLDMGRSFFRFNSSIISFFRLHWIDILVLGVIVITLSVGIYLGVGRINYLLKVQRLHKVSKFYHLRYLRKFIKKSVAV